MFIWLDLKKFLHNFTSCSSQSSLALASRSCCRVSLTCIPTELSDASLSGVVAGCRCRRPSGRSSCPVPSATMSSTAAATSLSAWAAPTRCVRPACTNCTARPAPSIRRPSALILTCCRSTVPCCSLWELRWVRGKKGIVYGAPLSPPFFMCAHDECLLRSQMCSRWAWAVQLRSRTMRSAGCVWKSWLSTWNLSAEQKVCVWVCKWVCVFGKSGKW